MNDEFSSVITSAVESQEQGLEFMEKLIAVAKPSSVYGEPLTSGDHTVITASEALAGMGFGYGLGGGSGPSEAASGDKPQSKEAEAEGFGGGGGGGGVSTSRPVAVITIGPDGVQVEPVVDATKIALAFFTTLLSIFMMGAKMRREIRKASRG